MAELKTKLTDQSVREFLNQIPDEAKRKDCLKICELMEEIAHAPAKMWGSSIVGVGNYRYTYSTGKSGDWFMMGFAPRKANISLYIMGCNVTEREAILPRLGKHKTGKGCIYINKLSDIDFNVLKEMCEISYRNLKVD